MKMNVLEAIAARLNRWEVCWGLGASSMLYFHGIVKNPRDIDVIVQADHWESAFHALKDLAERYEFDEAPPEKYPTEHFVTLWIDDQEVDLIGGYKIRYQDGVYDFDMCPERITAVRTIGNQPVPLTSLEDWYISYAAMYDPKNRMKLIRAHVAEKGGFIHKRLLSEAIGKMKGDLRAELLSDPLCK